MADQPEGSPIEQKQDESTEENQTEETPERKITVCVKTPKEKENIEVAEDATIKERHGESEDDSIDSGPPLSTSNSSPNTPPTSELKRSASPTTMSRTKKKKVEKPSYNYLANVWVFKLNNLSKDQRIYSEKLVNDIFFEAELGHLGPGCRVVPRNPSPVGIPSTSKQSSDPDDNTSNFDKPSCSYNNLPTSPMPGPSSAISQTPAIQNPSCLYDNALPSSASNNLLSRLNTLPDQQSSTSQTSITQNPSCSLSNPFSTIANLRLRRQSTFSEQAPAVSHLIGEDESCSYPKPSVYSLYRNLIAEPPPTSHTPAADENPLNSDSLLPRNSFFDSNFQDLSYMQHQARYPDLIPDFITSHVLHRQYQDNQTVPPTFPSNNSPPSTPPLELPSSPSSNSEEELVEQPCMNIFKEV